ncbi:MAG: basic secretory proteinF5/8 type protein [Planctomycetaceae bacterium]|nr:basic secretory proteinF5/8 type protein [Planctomycetaceae bacterium]
MPAFGEPAVTTKPAEPPVRVVIETSLKTGSGQIRQFAFDGQPDTFFASEKNAVVSDFFTLVFDKPVTLKSIDVSTGRLDGAERLDSGTLEVSVDGKTFEGLVPFKNGEAHSGPTANPIHAIRIKSAKDLEHPLVIREFTIESELPIARFVFPVEITIDVIDAPEMREWTEKVARICERAYPMINEELKSDGFVPARRISLTLKKDYDGVAFASGNSITGSVKFFKEHPDDVGAMVHETAHVVQHYRGRGNPGWLVEGVADYVRYFKFEPEKTRRLDPQRAHYNGSYHTSASFLAYITNKYDKQAVLKINQQMRDGKYTDAIFEQLTGKTLKELDEEWRASLKQ